jgi:UDP-N-acetylmuramate--alanine ligase
MLAMLMARGKGIAIAGAHGKTTTTSMIAMALEKAGADPTILIGGEVTDFGGNARLGSGDIVVAEADESDGSFLKLEPYLAVVTNIDDDHLDYYENIENVKEAFRAFLDKVQPDGTVVYCSSDPATCEVVRDTAVRRLAYGLSGDAYITARDITKREWGSEFVVVAGDKVLGAVSLKVPGTHNVENALAAICVGWVLGFEFKALSEGLAGFGGAQRRLQHVGEQAGVLVLDDYAHHPTEVKASLRAIREHVEGRVICVYQPHRYSRTLALKEEFGTAFESCDILLLAPIYPGPGEKRMPDVDSSVIAIEVTQKTGKSASYFDSPETLVENAILLAEPGDAIVTMGAGDVYRLGPIILDRLSTT